MSKGSGIKVLENTPERIGRRSALSKAEMAGRQDVFLLAKIGDTLEVIRPA